MQFLQCKACQSNSMVPMEVELEASEEQVAEDRETNFYTCQVCGDNWLSVRETDPEGACLLTFIHQMGVQPQLRRIAHMQTPLVLRENTVDRWEYFLGDEPIQEEEWLDYLDERRRILKAVCSN